MADEIFLHNGTSVTPTESTEKASSKASAKASIEEFISQLKASVAATRALFSAKADDIMSAETDWIPTGLTHEGTAPPPTPEDTMAPVYADGYCGVDMQVNQNMIANGFSVTAYLRSARWSYSTHTKYRWVQDRAYIPAGKYTIHIVTTIPQFVEALTPLLGVPYDGNYDAQGAVVNAIQPLIPTWIREPGYPYGWGYCISGTLGTNGSRTWMYYSVVTAAECPRANYSTLSELASYLYPPQVDTLGLWHLEKTVDIEGLFAISGTPETCISHTMTIELGNKRGTKSPADRPPRPNRIKASLSSVPSGSPGFDTSKYRPEPSATPLNPWALITPATITGPFATTITVTSPCTTKVITAPNIWDIDLSQIDLPEGYVLEGEWKEPITTKFTIPGSNFITQEGNALLGYNVAKGALVWDIQLKKWGKLRSDYSILIDHVPVNIPAYAQVTYTDLGMTAGTWNLLGDMTVFSDTPAEGYIKYGKLGYYRLGMIHFLEARLDFRRPATASITIDSSLDGRTVDPSYSLNTQITAVNTITLYPNIRYKWNVIKIEGQYDIQYMEIRANNVAARR